MADYSFTPAELHECHRLLWPTATEQWKGQEDIQRWFDQGFVFNTAQAPMSFGLTQRHGGPCGVLMAVQGYILLHLLFRQDHSTPLERFDQLNPLDTTQQHHYLVKALSHILSLVAHDKSKVVVFTLHDPALEIVDAERYQVKLFSIVDSCQDLEEYLLQHIADYASSVGVMLFVLSVLLSHGITRVREEMDDSSACLTAQFGHCNQELVNLLLCGRAVSNVFDGDVPLGDDTGMVLHGIPTANALGYLSHLESLRYCKVGSFYKNPTSPIWIIGSTSHFSLLFGLAPIPTPPDQVLLQDLRQRFQQFDVENTGMLQVKHLPTILRQLELSQHDQTLREQLVVPGTDIILWNEFWKALSVLLLPPEATQMTDEQMARALQEQWDAEEAARVAGVPYTPPEPRTVTPVAATPTEQVVELYHYNALAHAEGQTTRLVHLTLTQTFDPVIGVDVPLYPAANGGHGRPIEDVLHSKWTDAKINWHGQPPASID